MLYQDEVYAIQGAIFDVYKEMGAGFLESVYQECLELELASRQIPFVSQAELRLKYKDKPLKQTYRPDFMCFDKIIVELKATKDIDDVHRAQVYNYLKATELRLGLLVNFGHYPKATVERIII
jgi:GxxExxY protein